MDCEGFEFDVLASQMADQVERNFDEAEFDSLASQMTEQVEENFVDQGADDHVTTARQSARFGQPVSDTVVEERAASSVPKNTRRKMEWASNVFNSWRAQRSNHDVPDPLKSSLTDPLHSIPETHMVWLLQRFVLEVRNSKGEYYPPDTLYQLCVSLQKALTVDGKRDDQFFNSWEYKQFADVLDGELKRLRRTGAGSSARQAAVLTEEEEEQLWAKGVLGSDKPKQLLQTIFFMCDKHFALRSGDEHRSLRLGSTPNLLIHFDPVSKRHYVEYREDVAKNSQGGLRQRKLSGKCVRAYDNPERPDRCFVKLLQKYLSRRPDQCPEAFYLKPLSAEKNQWYAKSPIGHNTLKNLFREMCRSAGLHEPVRFTNHSLRRTAATRLYEAQVDEQLICEVTGHRSTAVRSYKRTSSALKEKVSDVLQGAASESSSERPTKKRATGNCPSAPTTSTSNPEAGSEPTINIGDLSCSGGSIVINLSL